MSFNRTDKLIARVLRECSKAGIKTDADVILEELNTTQTSLCTDYFAMEDHEEIVLEKGTESYDLQGRVFKIAQLIEPTSWLYTLEIIESSALWKEFKQTNFTGAQPRGCFVWDDRLHLTPAPTITGEKLEAYLYGLPAGEITHDDEPEIGSDWDNALFLGAMSNIVGDKYIYQFTNEANKKMGQKLKKTTGGVIRRDSVFSKVGF